MSEINTELREQTEALFTETPPAAEAFTDTTEVTVTLSKGQAWTVRSLIRADVNTYLQQLEFAESFGQELSDQNKDDINDFFQRILALEAAFAAVAPDSEYVTAEEPELVGM